MGLGFGIDNTVGGQLTAGTALQSTMVHMEILYIRTTHVYTSTRKIITNIFQQNFTYISNGNLDVNQALQHRITASSNLDKLLFRRC